jgi:hypothetical protein
MNIDATDRTLFLTNRQEQRYHSLVLVRGLAMFVGGFGEALTLCASSATAASMDRNIPPLNTVYSCLLPSSSVGCVEFTIRGMTHILFRSFHSTGVLND